jgi:general secretion pathway protein G
MQKTRRTDARGFTLLEVLLVLAILVVLASLVTVFLVGAQADSYSDAARNQIGELENVVNVYKIKTGQYPKELDDLVRLPQGMTPQKWRGPHLSAGKAVPKDPWENAYTYTLINNGVIVAGTNTQPFTISSNGPDGNPNTEDDISNKSTLMP